MHHDSACLPVPIDLQCCRRGATRAGRRHTSCVKWRGVGMSKTGQYHTLDIFHTVANVPLLRFLFFCLQVLASSFLGIPTFLPERRGRRSKTCKGVFAALIHVQSDSPKVQRHCRPTSPLVMPNTDRLHGIRPVRRKMTIRYRKDHHAKSSCASPTSSFEEIKGSSVASRSLATARLRARTQGRRARR